MRLDKYLKVSRIIKRRTIANEACDLGRVSVNGKIAKAGAELKVGDIVELRLGAKVMKIEVLKLADHMAKELASEMYQVL